jgi:SAM-dependent methyltransferase
MGNAFKEQGKLDEAIEFCKKALSHKPDYAEAHCNMGNAFKEQGKLDEAIEFCKKALSHKPDYAEAHCNMGNALKEQGKLNEAIASYKKALSLEPDYEQAYRNMGFVLQGVTFTKPSSRLQSVIISILEARNYVRPIDIASAAISLLKFEPAIKNLFCEHAQGCISQSFHETILALADAPLLFKLMSICPLNDTELEAVFTNIRSRILASIAETGGSSDLIVFQSALALQCFTNEYVYVENKVDRTAVQRLDTLVKKSFSNGKQPDPQSVLCLASYKALHEYEWCNLLIVTNDIEEVFARQVIEPDREARMKLDIPVLREVTDEVSSKVRQQYEQSPYPRWTNLGLAMKPATVSKVTKELNLKLVDEKINELESPDILIAGCGTGQHSLNTASRFKKSRVLAIDLSLSSLAYAKRKTEQLGITNLEYMQADILDAGKLNKKFDIVESSGVLHHMDDPMAGWKTLTNCLKAGGLMNIGLYSLSARQDILKTRQDINNAGIGSSDDEMRAFRATLMKSDQHHHRQIINFSDFFSLSNFRDLLFHVQEHRFTIPQIQNCLSELGLKFCGFEEKSIVDNFKLLNASQEDTYNLDKWAIYEEINPLVFAGMYQFWCQKEA